MGLNELAKYLKEHSDSSSKENIERLSNFLSHRIRNGANRRGVPLVDVYSFFSTMNIECTEVNRILKTFIRMMGEKGVEVMIEKCEDEDSWDTVFYIVFP